MKPSTLQPSDMAILSAKISREPLACETSDYQSLEPTKVSRVFTRSFDILFAATVLLLTAAILLFIAVLIRLDSKGPLIYRQRRFGRRGTTFHMLKFRSMVSDADARKSEVLHLNEADGPHFKIKNDPRVTRVGRFLRSTSLDEFPQFINVLLGHMTIVGPRAMYVSELDLSRDDHWHRLSVKPGILCLREVTGRSRLDFDEWIGSDLYYIQNKSLRLDCKILLLAIPAIIKGDGAY